MNTWIWDELDPDNVYVKDPNEEYAEWEERCPYTNGVRRYTSDRGHLSLEVEAINELEARKMFQISQTYRDFQ